MLSKTESTTLLDKDIATKPSPKTMMMHALLIKSKTFWTPFAKKTIGHVAKGKLCGEETETVKSFADSFRVVAEYRLNQLCNSASSNRSKSLHHRAISMNRV